MNDWQGRNALAAHPPPAQDGTSAQAVDADLLYRHIVAGVQEGIVVYDRELRYRVWNPFMEKLTGVQASDVLGRTPQEIFPFIDRVGHVARVQRALTGQSPAAVEFPFFIAQTQRAGWVRDYCVPLHDGAGAIIGVLTMVSDMGAHKQAEASEAKYRTIFDAARDGIFIQDENGFLDCNDYGAQMYGTTRAAVIGHHPREFAPERQPDGRLSADVAAEKIQATFAGQPQTFEWQPIRVDGTPFDVEVSLSSLYEGGQTRLLAVVRDITERKRLEAQLRRLATTDPLTSLANRRSFIDRLEQETARQRRSISPTPVAVLMMDLDEFKQVNDRFGHPTGDALLQHFAALVSDELRRADTVGRLGGEEFGLLLPGSSLDDAVHMAQRLRQKIETTPLALGDWRISFTVSIGVTVMQPTDEGHHSILSRADKALYQAKRLGRNRVQAG